MGHQGYINAAGLLGGWLAGWLIEHAFIEAVALETASIESAYMRCHTRVANWEGHGSGDFQKIQGTSKELGTRFDF